MSADAAATARAAPAPARISRRGRRATSLFAHGEPMVWLTGGSLLVALLMIAGLLGLVLAYGLGTFWPPPVEQLRLVDGTTVLGEVQGEDRYALTPELEATLDADAVARARAEAAAAGDGQLGRRLLRTGNFDLTGEHFRWVSDFDVVEVTRPPDAVVLERLEWGPFYGFPRAFRVDGVDVATGAEAAWAAFLEVHAEAGARRERQRDIEKHAIGGVNAELRAARLAVRAAELEHGPDAPEVAQAARARDAVVAASTERLAAHDAEIAVLEQQNARQELVLATVDGRQATITPAEVVRGYRPNTLDPAGRLGVYLSRTWEFLVDEPREANTEGGVFPAIFGTVVMTLIMSIIVVPLGVLAALYLREYARQGLAVSAVRVAVNNLAGVPSIVFGVFGLGFFCYIVGVQIDELFYAAQLPNPKYGKGGLLWASLTLALLTLPVVIVATEEALAAVPSSMREGSYACGATRWQTIRRIVLPRAAPGIMTGMILAIARGAGEVAPLMLVGAVKLAPELPVRPHDLTGSFGPLPLLPLHPDASFMHLGFHIYDLGFQSQNSEAAKPMVYTTTLLLIGIVVVLNVLAISVRSRLRRRFEGTHI